MDLWPVCGVSDNGVFSMTQNQEANMSEVEPTKAEGPYLEYYHDDEGDYIFKRESDGNSRMICEVRGIGGGHYTKNVKLLLDTLNGASSRDGEAAEAVSTAVDLCNAARKAEIAKLTDALAASREKLETAEKKVNSAKQRLDTMLHVWELRDQDAFRSNAGDELRAISETLSAALSAVKEVGK